ncbi:hypothetical protein MKQ70_13220 [Chitinophaga sedimenti]|uniref:hypothetical protein n=1 Tax=Chitinophaga sedimenti TaxID=2033606 RepID=UPI002002E908|nr:hypothetical protein [Chitinophaga sedimenti]MCK7555928.1 hypothetical protein [Chitinophaga sedimenti]
MILEQQFDSLMSNEEMRRIVTWDLTDNVESLQVMGQKREDIGEQLFTQLTDEHFKNKTTDIRAVTAILVSSVYYLTLHAKMNGSTFCGIDIREQEGEMKIKKHSGRLSTGLMRSHNAIWKKATHHKPIQRRICISASRTFHRARINAL